ncbi:hypothetical protein J7T55_005104 [Diaporthe amygdali]|uniref:uncharacterized protein n=1 Tax=Phomopsis amygdali TaxID=1214568 RepID=UPI0022FECD87|nr:uncharacterized protein J7T55_005104 [Diaporthe amygdali]KAJ0116158.1 hypothetical protein J7T55_005104 [Diaporthe amygdali]
MISLGPFILIAGISVVILLCWAWLPLFAIAKLFRLGSHRNRDTALLPVRAAANDVRYRAEGFVPPSRVLRRDPLAFNPEVRHHNYLKADPRTMRFQNREAKDAYDATFRLARRKSGDAFERQGVYGSRPRPRSREPRRQATDSANPGDEIGIQRPESTHSRDRVHE